MNQVESETKWVLNPHIRHQRFFEEMTRIPHGSYNEKAYGDYLENFAKERNLVWRRDEIGNVVIYKPASKGYEDHPALAIQAHMDMVCVKDEGVRHDFEKDALELYIEDGFLKARGTTLGADNGTGVAYILSVLDDTELAHPPIEAVITVQEEVGLYGALALDPQWITARNFISLDCGGGDEIYISSLGGFQGTMETEAELEDVSGSGYEICITGLHGGYSGEYMEEHANAVKLMARLLKHLDLQARICLVSIEGGADNGKIAQDCRAVLTGTADAEKMQQIFETETELIRRELGPAEPELSITFGSAAPRKQWSHKDSRRLMDFLYLMPCGFRHRSTLFAEILAESVNWSRIELKDGQFSMKYSLRGSADSMITHVHNEVQLLEELFGIREKCDSSFPAWEFHDSRLLKTLQQVFQETNGKELGLIPVQGGLECGVFAQRYPDMDIIAMGPYGYDPHTTSERLDLANFDSLFEVFKKLLAAL